jgi:hypothetical protein
VSAPFGLKTKSGEMEGFSVLGSWSAQRYIVWINGFPKDLWRGGEPGEARKDFMTDVRHFIEDAIREKLEREQAKP